MCIEISARSLDMVQTKTDNVPNSAGCRFVTDDVDDQFNQDS